MTDIKEPINTTSDGTFLSVVCENPEKSVVGQKLGATAPQPPQELPPCIHESTTSDERHHKQSRNSQVNFAQQVQGMVEVIEEMGNLLMEETKDLLDWTQQTLLTQL